MRNLATKAVVTLHDRQMQHNLQRDEAGLTMLAYALGAAIVIVPLAILVATFGINTVTDAGQTVGNACTTAASDPNRFCA